MAASEDKITRIMNFLINIMDLEASAIARKPELLTRSLEKVIVPMCLRAENTNGLGFFLVPS